MRLGFWQVSASLLAVSSFGLGYGSLAIIVLLLIDLLIDCVE